MATPGIVGKRHSALAQEIRRTLAQYGELKDIIAMLGLEQLSPENRNVVARARRLERFLTQPFFTTEQFTGMKGRLVSLKDSLDGCERILRDEFKDPPGERALHDRGGGRGQREKEMKLKILLPFEVFAEIHGVARIVVETGEGSFGLLPQRFDCVAALTPGILTYETEGDGENFVAVDEGVLVKTGGDVLISVRRALGGTDLGQLRAAVEKEFLTFDEQEQSVRLLMAKMESGFLRRFATFTK